MQSKEGTQNHDSNEIDATSNIASSVSQPNSLANLHKNQTQDFQTIGTFLKYHRERRHYSLRDIAERTKIHLTMLEYLENDQLNRLPNKAYVSGYVKSVAKELGIDSHQATKYLSNTYYSNNKNSASPNKTYFKDQEIISHGKRFLVSKIQLGGLILLLISIALFFLITKHKNQSVPTTVNTSTPIEKSSINVVENAKLQRSANTELQIIQQANKNTQTPTPTPVTTQTLTAKNTSTVTLGANTPSSSTVSLPTTVKAQDKTNEKVQSKLQEAQKETSKEVIKAAPQENTKEIANEKLKIASKETVKEMPKEIPKETTKEELPKMALTKVTSPTFEIANDSDKKPPEWVQRKMQPNLQNLFVNATSAGSWLTYKRDNDPVRKVQLEQGKSLFIQGNNIRLFLGNSNAIDIFLNNKKIKADSKNGIKSLIFPENNPNNFKLPLFIYNNDGTVSTSDEYEKLIQTHN